jgi:NADH dehydrogenase
MNLVVGATGTLGTEICRLLRAGAKPVKALVRTNSEPSRVQNLKALGTSLAQGDLRDRRSLELACEGVTVVFATASAMPSAYIPNDNTLHAADQDGYLNLVAAASEAGVEHLIYISFPPMTPTFPLQEAKRTVEDRLRSSGLAYTILQPTYFMEVWLSPVVGFDYVNRSAVIYGKGNNPISWISYRDVAQFAVASLGHSIARNAVLELGGPEGVAPNDVVGIFEKVGGSSFAVNHVATEALEANLAAAADPMQKSLAGLMLSYAHTMPVDMGKLLSAWPLKLRSVEAYARSVL